ncbi:hypothetical protein HEK616_62300 [Streptomyces nigrescens]|uniref:ATP-binding protein n=2 Tax=Streptomyces TaxID=1883 RepID=A0ABM8A2I8_STRNI|nr:hypothetical protein [Streptomyces nigrescens]MEE4421220.1 hypothetical protein [Streptomyces sp. DSM 41528]BDM72743.1 hypothetical protein HEK616_62300 [Streptomyces nigrescens]
MRTNIRRAVVVAAATGLWALGSVAANAAELPVGTPELPATGAVTGATQQLPTGALTGTATKAAGTATGTAQKTVGDVAGKATGVLGGGVSTQGLPTGTLPRLGDVTGAVGGVQRLTGGAGLPGTGALPGATDVKHAKTAKTVTKAVTGVRSVAPAQAVPAVPGDLTDAAGIPALPVLPALPVQGV